MSVRVEIEMVREDLCCLIVRRLEPDVFSVLPVSTIGGCRIHSVGMRPRYHAADGSPRNDLLAFHLESRAELGKFKSGQEVMIEKVSLHPDETWDA